MTNQNNTSDFKEFLKSQVTPSKPSPKEIEWARKRFSSREEPPKLQ